MAEYSYSAINSDGIKITGTGQASSLEAMVNQLRQNGCIPLEVKAVKLKKKQNFLVLPPWLQNFQGEIPKKELQVYCRQMHTLLKAGIPLTMAITRLVETSRNQQLLNALELIQQSLQQGRRLSYGMSLSPKVFSTFYVNMVKVGESSGQLDLIFFHLAEYVELEINTKNKIKTAFRYPKMVLISLVIAVAIINTFVIPAFSKLFTSFQGTLPLPTRILITTSDFFVSDWYILLLMVILAIAAFRYWTKKQKGKIQWAKIKLKIPVIGWIVYRITLSRFAKLLSMVLRAGLTVVEGIQLVGASTEDAYFASKIDAIVLELERGSSLTIAIAKSELFPTLIIQMISIGEESGNIDVLLEEVAGYYDREIAYDLAHASETIEPLLLLVVGAIVLMLALGVFLPLWDMTYQISHKPS